MSAETLPELIRTVHAALAATANPAAAGPQRPELAVPVKRSVFPDDIVRLEGGKNREALERSLNSACGMTPAQYRERWGLPTDDPMAAPSYAERRFELAKTIGPGQKNGPGRAKAAEPAVQRAPAGKSGTRGRKMAAAEQADRELCRQRKENGRMADGRDYSADPIASIDTTGGPSILIARVFQTS